MKLDLMESGIQNIKQIAKEYNKAKIYFHIDLDGVTSAIAMKAYLESYGIKVIECQTIQYGGMEYAISKPEEGILPVLVDFSHGKPIMKIHTDHHDSQIQYGNSSKHFAHSKSNAGTISSIIAPNNIFPEEDLRVINMVDSAGYTDENVNLKDMLKAVVKTDKTKTAGRNHLEFGMIVNKLLLTYKGKPDFLTTVVMESNPSLMSMYQVIMRIIKSHVSNGDKGWVLPDTIEKNSQWYYDEQSKKSIAKGTIKDIEHLTYGQNALIGNTIVQVGGGLMNRAGSFDRYTAFRLFPNAEYFIMIWDSIGMMQVSVNPWNQQAKDKNVHLGELVINDIFQTKYVPLLDKPKYDISLLAIKKEYESSINETNEEKALGFDLNEFMQLFPDELGLDEEQIKKIETIMSWKPSRFEEDSERTRKAMNILNSISIPLSTIILKTSGGHPSITNLNGFAFLNQQQRINRAIEKGKNPYEKWVKPVDYKPKADSERKESTSLKILRSIAKDVVLKLNG